MPVRASRGPSTYLASASSRFLRAKQARVSAAPDSPPPRARPFRGSREATTRGNAVGAAKEASSRLLLAAAAAAAAGGAAVTAMLARWWRRRRVARAGARRPALPLLLALLALAPARGSTMQLAAAAGGSAAALAPGVVGDAEMGVQTFAFPVALSHDVVGPHGVSFQHSELRVYLRVYCSAEAGWRRRHQPQHDQQQQDGQQQHLVVRGFAGLFPRNTSFTSASYFYKQPATLQPLLSLSLVAPGPPGGPSGSWPLLWQGGADRHADMGLWPLRGPVGGLSAGRLAIALAGSSLQHELAVPLCGGADSGSGSGAGGGSRALHGLWNVATTTDPNHISTDVMARLLLAHGHHHQALGFAGTILRCNAGEAPALAAVPALAEEIAAGRLIIWPWSWEPPAGAAAAGAAVVPPPLPRPPQPYFWQVPRNQLALLAAAGHREARLAYLDLDEYLVLPSAPNGGGGSPGANGSASGGVHGTPCHGRPLLDDAYGVWTLPRYAALAANCTGEELGCWEAANAVVAAAGSAPPPARVQVTQCPCLLGKPVLNPNKVLNTRVHKSVTMAGHKQLLQDPECGFLLHMQALISSKRPWGRALETWLRRDAVLLGEWLPAAGGGGAGTLRPFDEAQRVMSGRNCLHNGQEVLRRCTQGG